MALTHHRHRLVVVQACALAALGITLFGVWPIEVPDCCAAQGPCILVLSRLSFVPLLASMLLYVLHFPRVQREVVDRLPPSGAYDRGLT